MSATRFAEIIGDKVHLRQGILAYRSPGGDPPAQKTGLRLGKAQKDQQAPAAARVAASQAILDRAYGRAPTFSTQDPGQFKRAIDMSDDELAAIIAKARLTVVK